MGNKGRIKIVAISTLIVLLSIVIFSYRQYEEYKTMNYNYNKIEKSMNKELDIYLTSLLFENKEKAELYMNYIANNIHKQIKETYGNELVGLEKDIKHPNEYSELTNILENSLNCIYINEDTNSNKPFVMSMDNILWNRSIGYNNIKNKKVLSIDDFINGHYNKNLSKNAITDIKNMNLEKDNFMFWEVRNNDIKNHKLISNVNIQEILKVYKNEGIQGLKSYDILVPIYITKDGDIFGTKDINSLGFKVKNYKIIIVQRLDVYSILKSDINNISYFENEIEKINNEIIVLNHKKVYIMIQSVIFIIFILIGSSCLQNKINDKE